MRAVRSRGQSNSPLPRIRTRCQRFSDKRTSIVIYIKNLLAGLTALSALVPVAPGKSTRAEILWARQRPDSSSEAVSKHFSADQYARKRMKIDTNRASAGIKSRMRTPESAKNRLLIQAKKLPKPDWLVLATKNNLIMSITTSDGAPLWSDLRCSCSATRSSSSVRMVL